MRFVIDLLLQSFRRQAALLVMLLLLVAMTAPAFAQYGGGCSPGYCPPNYSSRGYYQPSYRTVTRSSDWQYSPWVGNNAYAVKWRTEWDNCGHSRSYNDGWLYTPYWHEGRWCYRQHCLINAYGYKPSVPASDYIDPRGATEVGYRRDEYDLVKVLPLLLKQGVLQQADIPGSIDPRSFLADYKPGNEAREAAAERMHNSTSELAARMLAKEQEIEHDQVKARNVLAQQAQANNGRERVLSKLTEVLAVLERSAVIDANATARGGDVVVFDQAKVPNQEFAKLLNDRCVRCHGPGKQAGGLDLRNYASFDSKKWGALRFKCETGEMPDEGELLTPNELELFDGQVKHARSKS